MALHVAVDNNLEFKIGKEGSYLQKNKKEPWRPKASKASISHYPPLKEKLALSAIYPIPLNRLNRNYPQL
jgi:hypothetical protein